MTISKSEQTTLASVALTRLVDYRTDKVAGAIAKQFSLLGGLGKFITRGDSVLIKPNLIAAKPRSSAVQTDPAVILAVAQIVKDFGAKPFIGDSPAWGSVRECIRALELEGPLAEMSVPIKQLNKPVRHRIAGNSLPISNVALQADKIINLPKFKAHQQLQATFAVKNMFGCVCGKEKALRHFITGGCHDDFCRMLIGIYELLAPALTIIDGVVAMEGAGPLRGEPKALGFLIGSADPMACEVICCKLIDFKPEELPIIQTARQIDFGCSDLRQLNIVGDDYADFVCPDFARAEQKPLKFSLPQICRSIARQAGLLAKSALKR